MIVMIEKRENEEKHGDEKVWKEIENGKDT